MRLKLQTLLHTAREDEEIPMAPLIDCVFLLLIYFMVTSSLMRMECDLGIQLPGRIEQAGILKMPDEQIVEITADGRIMLNNQTYDEDGARDLPELTALLVRFKQSCDLAKTPAMVTVQSADEAVHERLVDVLNACAGARIKNVSVGMGGGES